MTMPPLAILAGGVNTRMRSLRETVYKGFLPIEDASLVARHLLRAALFGITDAVVITDEDDALVRRSLAGAAHPNGLAVRHEVCAGGMEDKLLRAAELYGGPERLLAVLGDTVAGVDLVELAQAVDGVDTHGAVAIAPARLPVGVVTLDETGTKATSFQEKPALDGFVYTGYLCLARPAVEGLASTSLAHTLATLAKTNRLGSVTSTTEMWALDTPTDLARLVALDDAERSTGDP